MTVSVNPLNFLEVEEFYKISWVTEITYNLELESSKVH